jgi:hypothetical protein
VKSVERWVGGRDGKKAHNLYLRDCPAPFSRHNCKVNALQRDVAIPHGGVYEMLPLRDISFQGSFVGPRLCMHTLNNLESLLGVINGLLKSLSS